MTAPRPLSIAQVLRAMVQVYRRAFLAFLLVALVAAVPEALVSAGYDQVAAYTDAAGEGQPLQARISWILARLLAVMASAGYSVVAEALFGGIAIVLAANVVLGRAADVAGACRLVTGRLGSLVLVVGVTWVVMLLLSFTILGIPFAIYIGLGWLVASQVVMFEGLGWRDALRRSRDMVRWHRRRLLVVVVIVTLAQTVPYIVLYNVPSCLLFGGIGEWSWLLSCPIAEDAPMVVRLADVALQGLIGALVQPLLPIGVTLLYYDIQVRDERLDLDLRSARRGQSAP